MYKQYIICLIESSKPLPVYILLSVYHFGNFPSPKYATIKFGEHFQIEGNVSLTEFPLNVAPHWKFLITPWTGNSSKMLDFLPFSFSAIKIRRTTSRVNTPNGDTDYDKHFTGDLTTLHSIQNFKKCCA